MEHKLGIIGFGIITIPSREKTSESRLLLYSMYVKRDVKERDLSE